MNELTFKFYSILKNEDAMPYIGEDILVAADGLGGSGSAVHAIDRRKHEDMRGDLLTSAFGDMNLSPEFAKYVEQLIAPMVDERDDTSALWASRIVIARCVYALEGEFKGADLSDEKTRKHLVEFISQGLTDTARKFKLQNGKYDGQLLLPTTLAFVRYQQTGKSVIAETLWAGDSRCYALTPNGLLLLSKDDEDSSGAITNLFYADNKKTKLNYLRHELPLPCILLAVSDGVFDPFDPNENLGVEHTLLSKIRECASLEELCTRLKKFFDGVHADDATMAFVPLGFGSYEQIQQTLSKRTDEILAIREQQAEMYSALQVLNQSEEEARHYVSSRTSDRFDYVLPVLVDALESGSDDIIVTPAVRGIVEDLKKDLGEAAVKAQKERRAKCLNDLSEFVLAYPERVFTEMFTAEPPHFDDRALAQAYSEFKRTTAEIVAHISNGKSLQDTKKELDEKQQELHERIYKQITTYRELFDALWDSDGENVQKQRRDVVATLFAWESLDNSLKFHGGFEKLDKIPLEDRPLAFEARAHADKYKDWAAVSSVRSNVESALVRSYSVAWCRLFDYIQRDERLEMVILGAELAHRYVLGGAKAADDSLSPTGSPNRDVIIRELKAKKADVANEIVNALAANCNKTSLIDSQYNGTKLELFRTYYRMKSGSDSGVKALEQRLADLEKGYTSLIK